jgi:hypothetical protein
LLALGTHQSRILKPAAEQQRAAHTTRRPDPRHLRSFLSSRRL